jgi:hypothetical protein
MKHLCFILIAIASASSAMRAQNLPDSPKPAQSNSPGASSVESSSTDWNSVADLAHDDQVIVSADGGRNVHCLFSGAVDSTLFCEPYLSRGDYAEYRFPRNEVETVRLNQQRRNQHIIFWSITAAGFIWGVSGPSSSFNGTPRALMGIAGGAAGAFAGMVVSFPVSLAIPGKLVYRRPANPPQASTTTPKHHFLFRSAQ